MTKVQLGAFLREASELDFLFFHFPQEEYDMVSLILQDINDAQAQWRDTPGHDL